MFYKEGLAEIQGPQISTLHGPWGSRRSHHQLPLHGASLIPTHDLQRHVTLGLKLRTRLYHCEPDQTLLPGYRIALDLQIR